MTGKHDGMCLIELVPLKGFTLPHIVTNVFIVISSIHQIRHCIHIGNGRTSRYNQDGVKCHLKVVGVDNFVVNGNHMGNEKSI